MLKLSCSDSYLRGHADYNYSSYAPSGEVYHNPSPASLLEERRSEALIGSLNRQEGLCTAFTALC